jgi:Methyltransferase FkbM domain
MPVLDGVPQEQWASTAKGYGALGDARVGERRVTVPLRRLDGFGLADLTAVKLDAEGAEYEVLRGARETLLRCRPVLSVEIEERHRPGSTWAVPAFLDALGYDTFWEHWDAWRPMAEFDRALMHRASPNPAVFEASDPYVFVFYALPRENAADMLARLRAAAAPAVRPRR